MKYLLDTNVCVGYIRGKNPVILRRFLQHAPTDIALCAVVLAELYYGAERSARPAAERALVDAFAAPYVCLPLDPPAADAYGRIRTDLESRGLPISEADFFIASIALAHGLTLVTHNTKEFSRVPNLTLEDWEVP